MIVFHVFYLFYPRTFCNIFWFSMVIFFFFFFGTTIFVRQGMPVPLVGLVYSDLLITHSRIVCPTYGGTVRIGLVLMMDMLLSLTS